MLGYPQQVRNVILHLDLKDNISVFMFNICVNLAHLLEFGVLFLFDHMTFLLEDCCVGFIKLDDVRYWHVNIVKSIVIAIVLACLASCLLN